MRFFLFLFSIYVVIVQGKAQYQLYYEESLSPYPNNQYPNYYPAVNGRTPNLANGNRYLFGSVFTSTTTTITTTTTTCTVSTAATCNSGRKKKALEDDDGNIEPSSVNEVEATQLPEMESLTRKERKPDPQFAYWRSDSPDSPIYELRSTIGRRPFTNNYSPLIRRPMIVGDPRFLLYYAGYTTTATYTVTTTSRSTPICSQASNFNTC